MKLSLDIKISGAFGVRELVTAFVIISDFLELLDGKPSSLFAVDFRKIKDDYKSGNKFPHSKASRSFTLNLIPLALKRAAKFNRSLRDEEGAHFAQKFWQ